jgi:hypothetical protein
MPSRRSLLQLLAAGCFGSGVSRCIVASSAGGLSSPVATRGSRLRRRDRRATADPNIIAQSTEAHARIVAAIRAKNPNRAAAAMRVHLGHIEESTRRFTLATRGKPRATRSSGQQRAGGEHSTRRNARSARLPPTEAAGPD